MNAWVSSSLIALLCVAPLFAFEEIESVTVESYEVTGVSSSEIRRELDRLGPLAEDGVRYDGHTRWFITWTYKLRANANGCEVESFETELEVTMTLPWWKAPEGAPHRLVKQWERYSAALRLHEDGHREIALAADAEIRQRAKELRSVGGCSSLGDELNATAEAVLVKHRGLELKYDEATEHGKTQGARFN